jgi:hypothetical protein
VVGLVFCALAYPLIIFVKQAPALAMQFSVYVTLGVRLGIGMTRPALGQFPAFGSRTRRWKMRTNNQESSEGI